MHYGDRATAHQITDKVPSHIVTAQPAKQREHALHKFAGRMYSAYWRSGTLNCVGGCIYNVWEW